MKPKHPGRIRLALALVPEQTGYSLRRNLRAVRRLAVEAGRAGADLAAFEETALCLFAPKGTAVRVPGPETRALAAVARRYRMYLAVPLIERGPGGRHNSVVLFDRAGRIQTVYRKLQLTNPELMAETRPGTELRPIRTDFGWVGFLVCYDTQFPELMRMLGASGVDLMILPHVGGAGADGGDLIGRAWAMYNHCWVAWVGRYATSVISPRGTVVSRMRKAGCLLVTDIEIGRMLLPGMNNEPHIFLDWKAHQFLERRPDLYGSPLPPVEIRSRRWPLYVGNTVRPGPGALPIEIVNRTDVRQRGRLRAEFPVAGRLMSDEGNNYTADQDMGPSWRPAPSLIRYDLAPRASARVTVRFTAPRNPMGPYVVRISGRTPDGRQILWQRILLNRPRPPRLALPLLAAPADVRTRGAVMPLAWQALGAAARAQTEIRWGCTRRALILWARCRRYGPVEEDHDADSISIAFEPRPGVPLIYWLSVHADGRTSAQRREHGYVVRKPLPAWTAAVRRCPGEWIARIAIPFRGTGPMPRRRAPWRLNVQRTAPAPDAINRRRQTFEVQTPDVNEAQRRLNRACEWSVWNPTFARIDSPVHFGEVYVREGGMGG